MGMLNMIIDDRTTLKELMDNDFIIYYAPATVERFELTRTKCPKCGSFTVQDVERLRCMHCDWGN